MSNDTPVVILCGGRGTRFKEQTESKPKPMIEVVGRPILWHIMSFYAGHGYTNFILCLGFKADVVKRYFLDFAAIESDFTVDLSAPGKIHYHGAGARDWKVTCVDTGLDAMTGARLKRVAPYIKSDNLAGDGQLMIYQHHGFWQCMDTYRDLVRLEDEWNGGNPPWKSWQ
jgi:glucose-1-phosphate cytidylyltransferase